MSTFPFWTPGEGQDTSLRALCDVLCDWAEDCGLFVYEECLILGAFMLMELPTFVRFFTKYLQSLSNGYILILREAGHL